MKNQIDTRAKIVVVLIVVLTALAYLPVFQAEFVNYDDKDYVTENPHVLAGWSWEGVKWAFTTDLMGSWHPVTWLSHMTDVQLFGANPAGHHAVNLGLHLLNVLLALLLFRNLTGSFWGSAVGAAIFALHPLHVESVAWVAERKDLLSASFGLLAFLAYLRFVADRVEGGDQSRMPFWRSKNYWLVVIALALGLMSKPMLVSWPILLLVLDVFPLRRFRSDSWRSLLIEKLPLLLLVGIIALVTLKTQHRSEAVISLQDYSLGARLANAIYSLFYYLVQFIWPARLAMFYPLRSVDAIEVLLAVVVLSFITVMAIRLRHKQPWLLLGWLWYLVVIFPVCGLVQAGLQAHADRYTYLPSLGWSLGLVLPLATIASRLLSPRVLSAVTVGLVFVLGMLTFRQAHVWQNSERLFRHALAVTEQNFMAHQGLGEELAKAGQLTEAKAEFTTALQIYPKLPSARNNLAVILLREQQYADAVAAFQQVLAERPDFPVAHFNLAQAYEGLHDVTNAVRSYQAFLAAQPDDYEALLGLGRCLGQVGETQAALSSLLRAQELSSLDLRATLLIAALHQEQAQFQAALAVYESALAKSPNVIELCNNFAWFLATCPDASVRDGIRAVQLAEIACAQTASRQPFLLGTLAAAYAEAGQFVEAVATAQKAIDLAKAAGQPELAARNAELQELYRARKPYHEPAR